MSTVITTSTKVKKKIVVKKISDLWIHIIMTIVSCMCILPFILIFIISISDEKMVDIQGYSFFPLKFSSAAYTYLFNDSSAIVRAYGITIFVTIVGTTVSLLIGSMLAYVISRKDFPLKNILAFYVFFTMLFNGGLVPWFLVYSHILNLNDSFLALIVPNLLLSGFNVLIMRSFFSNNVEVSLIEAAYLDGAGEFRIFLKIVLPLSLPVLATIGLFTTLSYWNDWFNSLIFMNNNKNISLQYLMTKALMNIQFLKTSQNATTEMGRIASEMPSETVRMAMAIVGVGPILLAYPFFQKYFIRGLTIGSVKG